MNNLRVARCAVALGVCLVAFFVWACSGGEGGESGAGGAAGSGGEVADSSGVEEAAAGAAGTDSGSGGSGGVAGAAGDAAGEADVTSDAVEADAEVSSEGADAVSETGDSSPDSGEGEAGSSCAAGVSAGYYHTCARKTDGTLWCWGGNAQGQLGDGTTVTPKPSPTQVVALGTDVAQVTTGYWHTCARKTDGTPWCWGGNDAGQVGNGKKGFGSEIWPVEVAMLKKMTTEVAAGYWHTCAAINGVPQCWGANDFGQLGNGTTVTPDKPWPDFVYSLPSGFYTAVAVGFGHTCTIKSDGTLWCWGANSAGQLGDGTTVTPKPSAIQVASLGAKVTRVAAGGMHTCAIKSDGTLWCWGDNDAGQLGDGTTVTPKLSPVQVISLGTSVVQVATGPAHTCAIKSDGTLWCWGDNSAGQLGDGAILTTGCKCKSSPVQVTSLGTSVTEVSASATHTCARKSDGTLWCWGDNGYGQLGDGTTSGLACGASVCKPSPVQVKLCP